MNRTTNSYSPVEIYTIMEGSNCHFIDMLTLILTDLISKNVLTVQYQKIGNRDEAKNLKTGIQYDSYSPMPHDIIFLKPFKKNPNVILQFKHGLQIGIQIAKNKKRVLSLVLRSENLQEFVSFRRISPLLGKVWLNKKGRRLSEQFARELSRVRQELDKMIPNAESQHSEILDMLRNRFYYLKNYDVRKIFGSKTLEVLKQYKTEDYDIHYELSMEYFKNRLQLAHVELLQMDYVRDQYEDDYYDDFD